MAVPHPNLRARTGSSSTVLVRLLLAITLASAATGASAKSTGTHGRQQAVETHLVPAVPTPSQPRGYTIRERMARYQVPGLSIAVIHRGRIAWTAGYGVLRNGSAGRVTPATQFQAASLSKLVTAVGALRLVDRQRLRLDDPIRPDFAGWTPPAAGIAPPTLRGVLSHTAGLTPCSYDGYAATAALPTLIQVLTGKPPANSPAVAQGFAPGRYRYSGGGYELVEWLMEQAAGRSFTDLMQRLVLAPLGMRRSSFAIRQTDQRAALAAPGHGYDGQPVADGWRNYPEHAAAGLWSTPTDLGRLAIAVARSWRGQRGDILAPATARTMLTAVVADAGLGPGIHGTGAALHFDHAGSNRGYRAYLVMYPATGDGVVAMANHDNADLLIGEVVRAVSAAYGWPDFKPTPRATVILPDAALDALAGSYAVAGETGFDLTVARRGDHLLLSTPRGSTYEFYAAAPDAFFATEDGAELSVGRATDGKRSLRLWGLTAIRR